jgi:crotonobetainyl-CoA:carnitine CoA-transferase CaiB-like acyl-CoA transferase
VIRRDSGVRWAGPDIGQHTSEVLKQLLGLDDERIDQLCRQGAI